MSDYKQVDLKCSMCCYDYFIMAEKNVSGKLKIQCPICKTLLNVDIPHTKSEKMAHEMIYKTQKGQSGR